MLPCIDPILERLLEGSRVDLPLPVSRFTDSRGATTPICAIQTSVQDLLDDHGVGLGRAQKVISVSRLCRLAGVALERPRIIRQLRRGHTGRLQLDTSPPTIQVPEHLKRDIARVAAAHELGHVLIHRRGSEVDALTIRLDTSDEEEALAEYAARLLLVPVDLHDWGADRNMARYCYTVAKLADVTPHTIAARLGDPDSPLVGSFHGIIRWTLNPDVAESEALPFRMAPQWHFTRAFIPIRRCGLRPGSLIAEVAEQDGAAEGSRVEDVAIGGLRGRYRVDAMAFGSVTNRTRSVWSVFMDLT